MHRTPHAVALTITTGLATLALGAAPALAGSDGCSDDGCATENAPPLVLSPAPVPIAAPGPAASPPARHGRSHRSHRSHRAHRVHRVHAVTAAPRGGVAAGAGGTAQGGRDGLLALLAAGAVVLVAAGGRLVSVSEGARS